MYIIPRPQTLFENEGSFKLKRNTEINLDYICSLNDLEAVIELQEEVSSKFGFKLNINKNLKSDVVKNAINIRKISGLSDEEYKIFIEDEYILINASESKGIFYGIQTLIQILKQSTSNIPKLFIEDKPYFKNRGFYHDVTRGKVPTLETLKEVVKKASFYKINQIQLYIEHTFAFKGMSEVWIDKDPLTAEEIILLDMYCQKRNVELIPSLSTFGHLYEVLRTKSFKELCEMPGMENDIYSFIDRQAHHTLDVTNNESLNFVEGMIEQFLPLFTSDKFNICCDETFDLGKGKSKEVAEEIGTGKLYLDFLNKIVHIVKKYDKKVMFWGDVILGHPELLNDIPNDLICLNWNYSCEVTEEQVKKVAETGREQFVCPGVGGWSQLMNFMDNGFENIRRMVRYGVEYGATGVLNTDWGDYGHINLLANSIPGMAFGGALAWNPNYEYSNEEFYSDLSLIEYEDKSRKLVSILNKLSKNQKAGWPELVIWKERYNTDEELRNKINSIAPNDLINGYNTASVVEEELIELAGAVNNKEDIQEFIISAQGIKLINLFFVELLKDKFEEADIINLYDKISLAEELEVWFDEYSKVWRKRNKESELNRIREVIKYSTAYLRSI